MEQTVPDKTIRTIKTGTGWHVTSKYGRTSPNKHGGVDRQQQQHQLLKK